jgi:hypothetical protein
LTAEKGMNNVILIIILVELNDEREGRMKRRLFTAVLLCGLLATVSAFAQMGSGGMGGPGPMPGPMPGPGPNPDTGKGCGKGYGVGGIGSMGSMMFGNTISYGSLDRLDPITDLIDAQAAFDAFINASNSNLKISETWEYGTVYKAELVDTKGAKAFDLIADKFTGAVTPEMGMSMMLNASYGMYLYKTSTSGKNLSLSSDQATAKAQTFVNNNTLGYTLGAPEVYPGYYKFHTTHGGGLGMDIMVDGYDGDIWMNTYLGVPITKY